MNGSDKVVDHAGNIRSENLAQAVDRINPDILNDVLGDFETFKNYLAERIALGEKLGMSEEQLALTAEQIADYLAAREQPRNREEQLLQALWKVGTRDERHMLAHLLIRLVHSDTSF